VLREMAVNAPTLFYTYVPAFFESVWPCMRDPKVNGHTYLPLHIHIDRGREGGRRVHTVMCVRVDARLMLRLHRSLYLSICLVDHSRECGGGTACVSAADLPARQHTAATVVRTGLRRSAKRYKGPHSIP
jgi:hypothetical protein